MFFVSFSPSTSLAASSSPSPPLSLARVVCSPSLSAQRHRQRPSFSFITSLPLEQSNHAHLIAVHFSLYPSFSAYTSVHLSLQTLPLLSVCQLGEKTEVWRKRREEDLKWAKEKRERQESKRESVQECRRKWREKKGNSRRNGGTAGSDRGRGGWKDCRVVL